MMAFNIQPRLSELWVLVADRFYTCLLQVSLDKNNEQHIVAKWQLDTSLNEETTLKKIAHLIPLKASIAVALSSELFQLKQIELDKNLSYKEQDIYLKAKLAKEMSCDSANVLFATEEVKSPFDAESQTVHSVIATNTTLISPLLSMLERRKLRCLRFESIGLTLSWFALNHCLLSRNKTWGIIESLIDTTVIYLFSGSGWICQKTFDISLQVADFASKLEQRIKQILVLSGIQLEVTLF